jgi:RNase P subunit RPR2
MRGQYVRTIKVFCKTCNEWIAERETEFVNIEEDFYGRDSLTFICPKCKTKQTSLRVA